MRQAWRDLLSIYYANTPVWRLMKSAGLLLFGFFCWSASSLLLAYRPEWTILSYTMAYGFVLIFWGPLTHLVVVPLVIRLRRTAEGPIPRAIARHGSKINLSVFFAIVLVLGTAPISPMLLDFQSPFQDDAQPDISTDLVCSESDGVVECYLTNPSGVDHIVVTSGETVVTTVDDPTAEFEFRVDDLEEVMGQHEYVVELRDEDGDRLAVFRERV